MGQAKRTGGQILVDSLVAYGVDTLFCVPGESYLAVLDALHDRQDCIHLITCRQEGGAAYMAEAFGKLTGTPGVCFVSRGPGAANAMIGVHTAYQDSTPMLLFIGQVARQDEGREAFQELNYDQVYGAVAKKVIAVRDTRRLPEQFQHAWNTAICGRPGPVVIVLPEDMLADRVAASLPRPHRVAAAAPDAGAIRQVAHWLDRARHPVIICGGAGWTPQTSRYLQQFSEKQQVPVVTAFRRSDTFDNTHPHYIGELGLAPNPELIRLTRCADLILVVGPRLGDITTSGYQLFEVPGGIAERKDQKLVHVHLCPEELNAVYQADLAMVCHPERFFQAISQLDAHNPDRRRFIQSAQASYRAFSFAPRNTASAVRMDKIAAFLRARLPTDTIITMGAGNYTIWAQRYYPFRQPRTQLGSTNGSMGYGLPAAIAAKITRPDKTVLCFSGDGCFLMNGQELATAVQYNLDIIILLVNNRTYGTIQMHQENHFPGRRIATCLNNPDFAALAKSYGAFGATVKKTAQFEAVFEQALSSGKPALIELQTDYY